MLGVFTHLLVHEAARDQRREDVTEGPLPPSRTAARVPSKRSNETPLSLPDPFALDAVATKTREHRPVSCLTIQPLLAHLARQMRSQRNNNTVHRVSHIERPRPNHCRHTLWSTS